ncbi:MAG: transporter [Gemmatimonadaceae bacterium]|nr:transporter [Gemmatimonadaceae bacterium]
MAVASLSRGASAQSTDTATSAAPGERARQSTNDAWWTGPMLAASPNTLPPGHFLVEPYIYDVRTPHSNGFGSLTYINFGLANNFTVGVIPTFGFNMVSEGMNSSGIGVGDVSLLAQYRLTQFHEGSWVPTTAIVVQEGLPVGKYDRLGSRPTDGMGGGAYSTQLSLYSQRFFWMPNGRILRTRLDLSHTFSNSVRVEDVSVYGTGAGFRGRAKPGMSQFVDLAGEYSVTQRWVLALDLTYRHGTSTKVSGFDSVDPETPSVFFESGSSDAFGFAPGVEYNWSPNFGVLVAARIITRGHNTASSVTPAIALNMFF